MGLLFSVDLQIFSLQTCVCGAHGKRAQHMRALLDFAAKGQRHVNLLRFRRLSLVASSNCDDDDDDDDDDDALLFFVQSELLFVLRATKAAVCLRSSSFSEERDALVVLLLFRRCCREKRRGVVVLLPSSSSPFDKIAARGSAQETKPKPSNNNACGVGKRRALCACRLRRHLCSMISTVRGASLVAREREPFLRRRRRKRR